jgi:predicted DNA-binding transcriptional regulator AlpA
MAVSSSAEALIPYEGGDVAIAHARPTIPAWIESIDLPPLLLVSEVQELLRCSRSESYVLARQIGTCRIGRSVRVPASAVRAWLAEQEKAR